MTRIACVPTQPQAIKARNDVVERLRVAGAKLDAGFGGVAPLVLSPVDPMVRTAAVPHNNSVKHSVTAHESTA